MSMARLPRALVIVSFFGSMVAGYLFDHEKVLLAAMAAWFSASTMLMGVHLIMVVSIIDMLKGGKK